MRMMIPLMLPELITEIPGPRSVALAAELRKYESHNVTYVADDWPIFWERAEGSCVWDADGNRFIDVTSATIVPDQFASTNTTKEC